MGFSEEQVRDIITLKESLAGRIDQHRKAMDALEKNIAILDMVLKESSFTRASHLAAASASAAEGDAQGGGGEAGPGAAGGGRAASAEVSATISPPSAPPIPIRKGGGDTVIANAHVTPDRISIILNDGIRIDADTPPFKSFFLDRIVGEMVKKDSEEVREGRIKKESVIGCVISKDGTDIREITIKNYRHAERSKDLINAAGWSLSRMLENARG